MIRRIAVGATLLLLSLATLRTVPAGATAPDPAEPRRLVDHTDAAPTPVSIRTDPPTTADPALEPDDPAVHKPEEAARSDRSIGSWLLVAGAFVAAAVGIGIVLSHTRHRHR